MNRNGHLCAPASNEREAVNKRPWKKERRRRRRRKTIPTTFVSSFHADRTRGREGEVIFYMHTEHTYEKRRGARTGRLVCVRTRVETYARM